MVVSARERGRYGTHDAVTARGPQPRGGATIGHMRRLVVALAAAISAACGGHPQVPAAPTPAATVPVSLVYRAFTPTGAVPVLGDYCFRNIVLNAAEATPASDRQ